VAVAVEGCTGWRYVVEEATAAGVEAHVADAAEAQAKRGPKRRAKTDRTDARLLRELLASGELPEAWAPPTEVLEWRERVQLYKALLVQRTQWSQRIHAELFHHGVPVPEGRVLSPATRAELTGDGAVLSPAGRERVATGYAMVDATNAALAPLRAELVRFGGRQPACRALAEAHYGIGCLTAVAVWCELGDCQRFTRSMHAVRHAGLDVTVHSSDGRRTKGHLSRQGPGVLRWALFEAAKCASRPASPDYAYYCAVKDRHDGKLATISMARKLALRCYHTLRSLSPDAVYAMP
jgi:transposase